MLHRNFDNPMIRGRQIGVWRLYVVLHACNPSTQEVHQFEASLDCVRRT
jgi:hypothetical protein